MTAARSDASLAALLLTQRLVDAEVAPLRASEYWSLLDRVPDPGVLLGLDVRAVATTAAVDDVMAERVTRLLGAATSVAFTLDDLGQSGVRVLTSLDEDYPRSLDALGAAAPPCLSVVGDAALLSSALLGVVGSREVPEDAADAARGAAQAASAHGLGVVSGGARGVDRLAMQAALDAEGAAVGVLADSLLRTVRDAEVRRAVTDGRLCLCTPFKPSAPFSVGNAMGRNKMIYALSVATFVVAADLDQGGTWAGAAEALERAIAPVLVWVGDGAAPGNQALVERGGVPVERVDALFPLPAPGPAHEGDAPPAGQLSFEV